MAGKSNEQPFSYRSRVSTALYELGLLPEGNEDLKRTIIDRVSSVIAKNDELYRQYIDGETPAPIKLLKNIALLKISYAFSNKEIVSLINNDGSTEHSNLKAVSLHQKEVALFSRAYSWANKSFPKLSKALSAGQSIKDIDLSDILSSGDPLDIDVETATVIPLHLAKCIEEVHWSDSFQEDDPSAISLAAEKYIELGALDIAEALIELALVQNPDHAGAWFQKSRLLLKRSAKAAQHASFFRGHS